MVQAPLRLVDWPEVEDTGQSALSPTKERRRRLLEAVRHGDAMEARGLIRRGAPLLTTCPELPGSEQGNLIDWALYHDKPDMAVRLLKLADSLGYSEELACSAASAVHVAARQGLTEVLRALLSRGASAVRRNLDDDNAEDSPLLMAALRGHAGCVAVLVSAGAWPVETNKKQVLTCARLADFQGLLPTVEATSVRMQGQKDLRVELEEAILMGDHLAVDSIVRRGASLSTHYHSSKAVPHRDESGKVGTTSTENSSSSSFVNPVDWAALESCPKVAVRLLELADELKTDQSYAAASWSVPDGESLAAGCRHAVRIAAQRAGPPRWLTLLRGLLDRRADCAQLDPWGRSALHLAVMRGHADAARLLVEHGAWKYEGQRDTVASLALGRKVVAVLEGDKFHSEYISSAAVNNEKAIRLADASKESTWTPSLSLMRNLCTAVRRADEPFIRILLGCPANSNGGDVGDFPLAAAQWLAAAEVELPGCGGARGNVIDLAAWHAQENIALFLFRLAQEHDLGRSLATTTRFAVLWAVQQDALGLLRALLQHKADPAQGHDDGGSALLRAAEQSRAMAAAMLLEAGAWDAEIQKERVLELLYDRQLLPLGRIAEKIESGDDETEPAHAGIFAVEPAARKSLVDAAAKVVPKAMLRTHQ